MTQGKETSLPRVISLDHFVLNHKNDERETACPRDKRFSLLPTIAVEIAPISGTEAVSPSTARIFTRLVLGDVDFNGLAVDFFAVETFNGSVGIISTHEGNEAKTARAAGFAIRNNFGFRDFAVVLEYFA